MANNSYEAVMVFSLAKGEEFAMSLKEKFQAMIEANATLEGIEREEKRKLAYLINDEAEGYYVFYQMTAPADFPAELERVANITDGVLRSLVIKKN